MDSFVLARPRLVEQIAFQGVAHAWRAEPSVSFTRGFLECRFAIPLQNER